MRFADVVRGQGRSRKRIPSPIRIKPRVQFQPALVRFFYGKRQRVIKWQRRLPDRAGEVLRPWLKTRGVKRIARRPYLENDGIELELHGAVKERQQFRFLFYRAQTLSRWPIKIRDRCDPGAAEFTHRFGRNDSRCFVSSRRKNAMRC